MFCHEAIVIELAKYISVRQDESVAKKPPGRVMTEKANRPSLLPGKADSPTLWRADPPCRVHFAIAHAPYFYFGTVTL